ncbi:MAG TPA: response regulator transcription factor [Mycobacteriales bacterium]|jgi:DNA-binding response OmpR family regulator|nr:response regulator transcription factor [Mycobacteriales bacterium]
MRVLVVDDEQSVLSFLGPLLEREGFATTLVDSGTAAVASVLDGQPDLVLLDVNLPDLSGLEVCRAIRRQPGYVPVILLTGLDSRDDVLAGYAAMADDYVTKPFLPEVVVAKVRSLLRVQGSGQRRVVRLGDVEVDLLAREARRDGVALPLAPKEFDLLAFLVEHPNQVFGRMQLLTNVWGVEFDGDPHTVAVRMSNLRAAIEKNPNRPEYLLTRNGVGYYARLPDGA